MTQRSLFVFENSPWWMLAGVLLAAGLAWLLYSGKAPWSATTNKWLATLRLLLVIVVCFLLLNPMLKFLLNEVEEPIFVFAMDNSASMVEAGSGDVSVLLPQLQQLKSQLEEEGKSVLLYDLEGREKSLLDSLAFDAKSTNLSALLQTIENDLEGRNLAATVMISDGIFNYGMSPAYLTLPFRVHTVGTGDTIPKKDLKIKGLIYNKIAYQGNKFPLVVELQNVGFPRQNVGLKVFKGGELVAEHTVTLAERNDIFTAEFLLEADQAGFHRYVVRLEEIAGEVTFANNQQSAYIEVIDGKQKVLMVTPAPHPDIKALVSAIEVNPNYEITTHVPGNEPLPEEVFDLVIFNEAFDRFNLTTQAYEKYKTSAGAFLFIISSRSNITKFNSNYDLLGFTPKQGQKDRVTPAFNDNFSLFTFNRENQNVLNGFPPLEVPYGDFSIASNAQVLFYQKVGSITTNKPLIVVQSLQEKKIGVIVGEGIWRWRLQEFAQNENTKVFDDFVSKLVQYLSTKEDKRKFRFYPLTNEYFDSEPVTFETEIYNNIYEKVYGFEVNFSIRDEEGNVSQYSFVNSPGNTRYAIGQVPQGVYKYTAKTTLGGKTETVSGEFTVKELQLESIELTARHDLLRQVSEQSGGQFFHSNDLTSLAETLKKENAKGVIFTSEKLDSIINYQWLFWLLVIFLSVEWFTRKYNGSY